MAIMKYQNSGKETSNSADAHISSHENRYGYPHLFC